MFSSLDDITVLRSAAFWGGLLLFLMLERVRPYRVPTVPKGSRWAANILIAVFNGLVVRVFFGAAIVSAATHAELNQAGLLHVLGVTGLPRIILTVLAMDAITYVWHAANHRIRVLWRFHRVHHCDLNMDVSTASRFHIGEVALAGCLKLACIVSLGLDLIGLAVFETFLMTAAQFHHSSIRISPAFERLYILFGVPPSMHRIHHSVVITEHDSNYGTIVSWWDRFFGTFRYDVPQERITIGMGAYRNFSELGFLKLLRMPFSKAVR
ncbi:MAG TPA: sterol desaturase family protein [Dissulfurispiraceae bacterium]|nr:sterol desaturase family protein [Dissulfurispiraceae bacterium]